MQLPERLALACTPTPFSLLSRLTLDLQQQNPSAPRIWIKRDDLTGSSCSGNKIRKLEFTLAEALRQSADTIITCGGLQSNHCRATAILCAQLGLHCHLILRGQPEDAVADGNLFLDQLVGASIEYHPAIEYQKNLNTLMQRAQQRFAGQNKKAFCIPTGASDGIGVWGYIAACEELKQDFAQAGISPSHIFSATGSGGTQAGLTAGNQLYDLGATVWGINVCDDAAYFKAKVAADLNDCYQRYGLPELNQDWSIKVIDGYVGPGYAKATQEVFSTIEKLARLEGVILDPVYTGKAFHGMINEIASGRFDDSDDVVFVHTGGIFGLFAQRAEFSF